MRRASRYLVGLGLLLGVLAGAWYLVVPAVVVKIPSHLDKTVRATGTFTLYADLHGLTPLAAPSTAPLEIQRRVHVVSSTGRQAVVDENDAETVKGLGTQKLNQQYVLNRTSGRNIASAQSWAYSPSNQVDRSPYWSVKLPFGTGDGPYWIWKNELAASYPFIGLGKVKVDGVTMQRLQGTATNAPVTPAYLHQVGSILPTTITPEQVEPWLQKPVYSRQAMLGPVADMVTPADGKVIRQIENTDWPLDYQMDVTTTLLVEPRTGAITDLARVDQTLYATPDLGTIRRLLAILAKPEYAKQGVLTATAQIMRNVLSEPPQLRVFNITYSQTPASVADITAYAKQQADAIDLVERTIPLAVAAAGVLMIIVGLLLRVVAARGPGSPAGRGTDGELGGPLFQPAAQAPPAARRASHRKPARHAVN